MKSALLHQVCSLLGIVAAVAHGPGALAQTLDYATFDAGGQRSTSANYSLIGSVAPPAVAVSRSQDYTLRPGFLGQLNDPPQAGTDLLVRPHGLSRKYRATQLLANDTDPEGGALEIVAAGPSTALGGKAGLAGEWVYYEPPTFRSSADQFDYLVADAEGDRALGLASLRETPEDGQSRRNFLGITPLANGQLRLDFIGIPNLTYRLEWKASLGEDTWQFLARVQAGPQGLISWLDIPTAGTRFYRALAE